MPAFGRRPQLRKAPYQRMLFVGLAQGEESPLAEPPIEARKRPYQNMRGPKGIDQAHVGILVERMVVGELSILTLGAHGVDCPLPPASHGLVGIQRGSLQVHEAAKVRLRGHSKDL